MTRSTLARALLTALFLLAASAASAQPFVQLGSGSDPSSSSSNWIAGAGIDARLPFAPVSLGILAQTTIGSQENEVWPARALGVVRSEFLPTPGVRAYAGVGGGFSWLSGGDDVLNVAGTGVLLGGIGVGRLHIELQYHRDWLEEDRQENRWNTVIGVTF